MAWPLVVRPQGSSRIPKAALIIHVPQADMDGPVPRNRGVRAFLQAMRNFGWNDGQNIQILRWSDRGKTGSYSVPGPGSGAARRLTR